jgi:hypothetical protein
MHRTRRGGAGCRALVRGRGDRTVLVAVVTHAPRPCRREGQAGDEGERDEEPSQTAGKGQHDCHLTPISATRSPVTVNGHFGVTDAASASTTVVTEASGRSGNSGSDRS